MKPQIKAYNIYKVFLSNPKCNYDYEGYMCNHLAKRCAMLVADECYKEATEISITRQEYWNEVKIEIQKIITEI